MKKKLFLATLASAVAIPALVIPMQAEAVVQSPFKDISTNNPYYDIIHSMRNQGIISGYPDGTFKPNQVITRKQASALVSRATNLKTTQAFVKFKDVSEKHPNFNDIKKVQQAGIFAPDNKGNFYPEQPVTRSEMAKILTIAFDLKLNSSFDFPDVPRSHPSSDYIRSLFGNGITTGDNGHFKPNASLTRAHYAVFMYRALKVEGNDVTLEDLATMSDSEVLALTDQQLAKLILPYRYAEHALPKGVTDAQKHTDENLKKLNQISAQLGSNVYMKKRMEKSYEEGLSRTLGGWSEFTFGIPPKEVIELINKLYTEGIVISSLDMETNTPVVMFYDYVKGDMVFSRNDRH